MNGQQRPPMTFDTRPLVDPVDPRAVAAFRREMRARHPSGGRTAVLVISIVLVGFFVVMLMMGGTVFALVFAAIDGGSPMAVPVLVVIPLVLVGALLVIGVLAVRRMRRSATERYRIAGFAAANGMIYEDRIDDPPLPGLIFQLGRSRNTTRAVRGQRPRFVEFGNYEYTTGSGKDSTTHRWGYVAVRLDVPLPNIVLDAQGNNALGTNLPATFARRQQLSLEGDFDRSFTLYCPEGYERDALYLFTPDIMARFIDHAAQLDVEIVDDWLFLYMQRPASTVDPATWAWLFGAVGALLTKLEQWARWRDERMPAPASGVVQPTVPLPFAPPAGMLTPPPGVAVQGRRLKRSVSWVAIAATVLAAAWILVQLLDGILSVTAR